MALCLHRCPLSGLKFTTGQTRSEKGKLSAGLLKYNFLIVFNLISTIYFSRVLKMLYSLPEFIAIQLERGVCFQSILPITIMLICIGVFGFIC